MLTPTVGHCRDVLTWGRRHLVKARSAGCPLPEAWAELGRLRRLLAGLPRDQPVGRALWKRCRAVGNAAGSAPCAWWNARRWGGPGQPRVGDCSRPPCPASEVRP